MSLATRCGRMTLLRIHGSGAESRCSPNFATDATLRQAPRLHRQRRISHRRWGAPVCMPGSAARKARHVLRSCIQVRRVSHPPQAMGWSRPRGLTRTRGASQHTGSPQPMASSQPMGPWQPSASAQLTASSQRDRRSRPTRWHNADPEAATGGGGAPGSLCHRAAPSAVRVAVGGPSSGHRTAARRVYCACCARGACSRRPLSAPRGPVAEAGEPRAAPRREGDMVGSARNFFVPAARRDMCTSDRFAWRSEVMGCHREIQAASHFSKLRCSHEFRTWSA